MLGGKNKQPAQPLGYTIIEVLIVLAVSGVMFVVAASFINGRQERASFTQASNEITSSLQGIVEDITDGHYSDIPIRCQVAADGTVAFPSGSGEQGKNSDCVFLGKIVRFYAPSGSSEKTNYDTYSIAAARNISKFPDTQVAAVTTTGVTAQSVMPQNLIVKSMSVVDVSGAARTDVFNIGFAQSIGNIDAASGVYMSGAQQPVSLIYANTSSGSASSIAGLTIQRAKSATMCITDGKRYAQVLIGGSTGSNSPTSNNDNQLNISVQQLGVTAC